METFHFPPPALEYEGENRPPEWYLLGPWSAQIRKLRIRPRGICGILEPNEYASLGSYAACKKPFWHVGQRIWKYWARLKRMMEAYRMGLNKNPQAYTKYASYIIDALPPHLTHTPRALLVQSRPTTNSKYRYPKRAIHQLLSLF